jgi:hypothetical protein
MRVLWIVIHMTVHRSIIIGIIVALGAGLLYCLPAYATTGLTVSPLRTEVEILPGKLAKGNLKLTNATRVPMLVRLDAEAFRVVDEAYDYKFDPLSNVINWVRFNETVVEMQPGQSHAIQYTITAPIDAKPGGYYVSMFASTDVANANSVINARQRVGSLFYITVTGEASRGGSLVSLELPLFISADSRWSMNIKSDAATHFRSDYRIAIYNVVGKGVVSESKGSALIMPDSVRRIQEPLRIPDFPGIYTAVVTVGLGDSPIRQETRLLIYVPIWASVIACFVVAAVTAVIIVRRKK